MTTIRETPEEIAWYSVPTQDAARIAQAVVSRPATNR